MSKSFPKKVLLKEMAPRDGLQNEKKQVSTEDKVHLIDLLVSAGHTYIETTAFVSSKVIPQLADAEEVMRRLKKKGGVTYSALVPNSKGMARAVASGVDEVAVFTAASETFNQKNINATIQESFERFADVFPLAEQEKMKVRGYVSTAFVCPYEGVIEPERAADVVSRLLDEGCYEVSVGDTVGRATPDMVRRLFELLMKKLKPTQLAGHFHDTRGFALANVMAAIEFGVTVFDSSTGGLGGCPYAPGASGNVATEDLVYTMDQMGMKTGLDLQKLLETSAWIETWLDRPLNTSARLDR